MPLFRCEDCGHAENTATSNYWMRSFDAVMSGTPEPQALCSACDPDIRQWHGEFPRMSTEGWLVDTDGFIYRPEEVAKFPNAKIVGRIEGGKVVSGGRP